MLLYVLIICENNTIASYPPMLPVSPAAAAMVAHCKTPEVDALQAIGIIGNMWNKAIIPIITLAREKWLQHSWTKPNRVLFFYS
jgi:hypothetical protein